MLPWIGESCTIRADIDENLTDYVSARTASGKPARLAILPFDVPENFYSPANLPGSTHTNAAQELARRLQTALLATGELGIVEVFDREVWQRKRDEFFRGNYGGLEQARLAGYDYLIVGMLEPIVNDETLLFQTKVIDLSSNITLWSGQTEVSSNARSWDRAMMNVKGYRYRADLFEFRERFELFSRCTADRMVGKSDR